MLKKYSISLVALTCLFMWFDRNSTHALSSQPPIFQASAPNMSSCASDNCHGGEINTGGGDLELMTSFEDNVDAYTNGSLLDISLTVNDPDALRYGFQMVALDANDQSVGNFVTNDSAELSLQYGQGYEFINHFMIPEENANVFNFQYQAPNENVGPISFYATAIAADGGGNPDNDDRYNISRDIMWTEPIGIESGIFSSVNISPNPVSDGLVSISGMPFEKAQVSIYDLQGKLQQEKRCSEEEQLDVSDLKAGVYLVSIGNERYQITRSVLQKTKSTSSSLGAKCFSCFWQQELRQRPLSFTHFPRRHFFFRKC